MPADTGGSRSLIRSGISPTPRTGWTASCGLLDAARPPTAFVCSNESTTLGVLSGLGSRGRRISVDVDVVAYDDINVSAYFTPPITTFYQPIEVLGRTLGEFLLRRMAGEDARTLKQVFRPRLIERQPDSLGGRLPHSV
nr:substrate-binding domain-containing protein [Sinorhizobium meliloti]